MRGSQAIWLVALSVLLLAAFCDAERRFNFTTPGSAKAQLGLTKLAGIRERSNQTDRTVDELALMIERDNDLVRRSLNTCI